jgi:acetyl-CoA acyltransferase
MIAGGSTARATPSSSCRKSFVHTLGPVAMGGKSGPADYLRRVGKLGPSGPDPPSAQDRRAHHRRGHGRSRREDGHPQRDRPGGAGRVRRAERTTARAAAIASGRFDEEVCTVTTPTAARSTPTRLVRGDTSVEKLAQAAARVRTRRAPSPPATRARSPTAAAAVLLMSEEKARALGFTPRAALRSWAYVGRRPRRPAPDGPGPRHAEGARTAPAFQLADIDFVDMHEAFAAQVLSRAEDARHQRRLRPRAPRP